MIARARLSYLVARSVAASGLNIVFKLFYERRETIEGRTYCEGIRKV